MKSLLLILASLVLASFQPTQDTKALYHLICTGNYSKSYHRDYARTSDYCNGLKGVDLRFLSLEASEAKAKRSDPCNWCYRGN